MPHPYHLKIPSAILRITFLGIALLAQQPAFAQQLRAHLLRHFGVRLSSAGLVAKDATLRPAGGTRGSICF